MNTGFAIIAVLSFVMFSSSCLSAQDKQKAPNFSGTWALDTSRSKLDEQDRIESLTLTVTQSKDEIHVDSALKLIPYDPAFMGGLMTRPLEQNMSNTYRFDGKETEGQVPSPGGPQSATLKANVDGGKLHLSQTHGDPVVTLKETWALSADGKMLTADRLGGTGQPSTLVFNKKQ
jgi:hypothetical protein